MFAAPRRRVRIMSPAVQLEDLTRTRTPTLDLPPGVSDGGVRASVPSGGGPWPGRSQLTAATVAVTVPWHTGTCTAAPGAGAVVTPRRLLGPGQAAPRRSGVRTSESESRRIRRSPLAAVRYGRNLPRRQFELPLAMRPGQVGPRDSAGRRAGARRGCRPGLSIRLASPGPDVKLRLGAHQVPGLPGPGRHQMSQLAAGASESESESRRLVTESRVPATRDSGESDELAGAGAASLIIE